MLLHPFVESPPDSEQMEFLDGCVKSLGLGPFELAALPPETRVLFAGGNPDLGDPSSRRSLMVDLNPPIAGYLENKPFLEMSPRDGVSRGLLRRWKESNARRLAAALSEGSREDQEIWNREVKRRDMLTVAILRWDDREPFGQHLAPRLSLLNPKSRSPQPAIAMPTTTEPMNKMLSHAQQSAILSHYPYAAGGEKVRVPCTHRTKPLLSLAGIREPRTLETYSVPVKRDGKGFLVVDTEAAGKRAPVSDSDDDLFETGGIFAQDSPRGECGSAAVPVPLVPPSPELAALCELPATRTYEIKTGSHSKIRVQVIAFEDEALPSPGEREKWCPRKPTDTDVHAAISALHMSRELRNYEQL